MSQPDLTIITLTVPSRKEQLELLSEEIYKQISNHNVEYLIWPGPETCGQKMRDSLEEAQGRYVCWVDDDDWVYPSYLTKLLEGISLNPDVVTFGTQYPNNIIGWFRFGAPDSINEKGESEFVKSANQFCAWKKDIALSVPWLPRNYSCDYIWFTGLRLAFPNLKEHHIHEVIHQYRFDRNLSLCQDAKSIEDSLKNDGAVVWTLRGYGKLMVSVGKNQPVNGFYSVQYPTGDMGTIPYNEVEILDRAEYL